MSRSGWPTPASLQSNSTGSIPAAPRAFPGWKSPCTRVSAAGQRDESVLQAVDQGGQAGSRCPGRAGRRVDRRGWRSRCPAAGRQSGVPRSSTRSTRSAQRACTSTSERTRPANTGRGASHRSTPGNSSNRERCPSVASSKGTGAPSAANSRINGPSCAKKGGTDFNHAAPATVGIRHSADRFQDLCCSARPVGGVPRRRRMSSAQARSAAGPPGRGRCRSATDARAAVAGIRAAGSVGRPGPRPGR